MGRRIENELRHTWVAAAFCAALGVCPPSGHADPTSSVEEAKHEFEVGATLFDGEEFSAALPHLQKAYDLSGHRPPVIFTLAQCERALGMLDQALAHYDEYLATKPKNAADVEKTIAMVKVMKAQKEAEAAAKPPPTTEVPKAAELPKPEPTILPPPAPPPNLPITTTPEDSSPVISSPWLWIGVGAAVVAVGVGVALASSPDAPYAGSLDLDFSAE